MKKRRDGINKKLEIRLIGAFTVTDAEGVTYTLPGRKDRAVLAFLAAHRGRPIARERLVELIWPGAAEGAGRASLRQSLSAIRKALPHFDLLSVDRDTVIMNVQCAETDIGLLEESAPPEHQIENLPLANGEAFLDDLGGISGDFDAWRTTEQSRIVALVSDLVDQLARHAEASSDVNKSVAALSQLVSLEPLNETSQRRYMKALIAGGQANLAIRQYQNLEKLLQEELGVLPEESTRSILSEAKSRTSRAAGPQSVETAPQDRSNSGDEGDLPKITVYQFRDLSNDGETRHFAEGLSDSIAAALSHISGLVVLSPIATSRSGEQTGPGATNFESGQERFALHGTVLITGNRVRVVARLADPLSGRVYWAEDYDRTLDDVLSVQDDITQRIAVELRIKLSEGEKIRVLANYTKNLEVWARLMRADVLINTLVEEDNIRARELLEEAVQIDPACAAAWSELADSYICDCMMGRRALPKAAYLDQAMRAAKMALDAEPGFTHALNNISFVQLFRGNFNEASKTARKAHAAAPRNPEIGANCAYVLAFCGHVDDAQKIIQRAIDTTPIPPMWYLTVDGLCRYLLGQYNAAIERLEEAVRLVPESAFARPYLVGALMETAAIDAAAKVAAEIHQVQPDFTLSRWPGADFADPAITKKLTGSMVRAGVSR